MVRNSNFTPRRHVSTPELLRHSPLHTSRNRSRIVYSPQLSIHSEDSRFSVGESTDKKSLVHKAEKSIVDDSPKKSYHIGESASKTTVASSNKSPDDNTRTQGIYNEIYSDIVDDKSVNYTVIESTDGTKNEKMGKKNSRVNRGSSGPVPKKTFEEDVVLQEITTAESGRSGDTKPKDSLKENIEVKPVTPRDLVPPVNLQDINKPRNGILDYIMGCCCLNRGSA